MNNDHLLDLGIDERPNTPLIPHILRYYGLTFAALAATVGILRFLDCEPYLYGVLGLLIIVAGRYYGITTYLEQNELKKPREIAMTMAKWNGGISVVVVMVLNLIFIFPLSTNYDIGTSLFGGLFIGLIAFFLEIVCTMLLHTIYIEIIKK